MKICGWGRYPLVEARADSFGDARELGPLLEDKESLIVHALGRSYGDSSLNDRVLLTRRFNRILAFDEETGVLECESGVSLSDIVELFLPRGWFLPVTPGTRFVTVGGAVASDVHGKNHHRDGTFCNHLLSLTLMLPDGGVMTCSPEENREMFLATCGGMGLTGVILSARFRLKKVGSAYIRQRVVKARNLDEIFAAFTEHAGTTYSVAWIDCLASGDSQGRSILMAGEHADDGNLWLKRKRKLSIPMDLPSCTLNTYTVSLFNALYYGKMRKSFIENVTDLYTFFYPLDAILQWNRIYGRAGFTQYQMVLPLEASRAGLKEILTAISASGLGSFLAVLKLCGPANENYLSFPREGYSLALDFKIEPRLFPLLDRLDAIVLGHGGRLYLTKDVRMSRTMLERGYPHLGEFERVRSRHGLSEKFASLQSKRLGV